MKYLILLIWMVFFHIVDDFHLQGWLANAKQKFWWENNVPDELYENDYKMTLIIHALSWTIMIHIPIIFYLYYFNLMDLPVFIFIQLFIINWVIHAIVDNLKANKLTINLIQDQIIHFIQIILTWGIYTCMIILKLKLLKEGGE